MTDIDSTHPETRAVHAGREDFTALGIHAPPIDLSTTYPVADLDAGTASFDALVGGDASASNPIYARLHNPTVARVERALATLEGTEACVAYASGMAAITALLLASRARYRLSRVLERLLAEQVRALDETALRAPLSAQVQGVLRSLEGLPSVHGGAP